MSIDYYNTNAQSFFEQTSSVDMSEIYSHFVKHIPVGGHILDFGCGSGRDLKQFLALGYNAVGWDASSELVEKARAFTGAAVELKTFDQLSYQDHFDGIWACASLLHVPISQLHDILTRIANALKNQGVLYCSFKYGEQERDTGVRVFTDMTEEKFLSILPGGFGQDSIEFWITEDKRPDRTEKWLNVVVKRP